MNRVRRKRATCHPTGFIESVTTAVPTNSHWTVSIPLCNPGVSLAGRITIRAERTRKRKSAEARRTGIPRARRSRSAGLDLAIAEGSYLHAVAMASASQTSTSLSRDRTPTYIFKRFISTVCT